MAEPARSSAPASRPGVTADHAGRAVVRPISRGAARGCSRPGCPTSATATLAFDYGTRRATIDALAAEDDPRTYDLCRVHADRTQPPHGWNIEDRRPDEPDLELPTADDLASPRTVAVLAAALRGEPQPPAEVPPTTPPATEEPLPASPSVEDEALAEFGALSDEDEPQERSTTWGVEEAWAARERQAPGEQPAPRTVPAARRD